MNRLALILTSFAFAACGGTPSSDSTTPPTNGDSDTTTAETTGTSTTAGSGESPTTAANTDKETNVFKVSDSEGASKAHGATPSKIKPTNTEAALKFVVVAKDKGPIQGVVIALTSPSGAKYYTQETDTHGYAEVLVPIGKTYALEYLSLGRRNITAKVPVANKPRLSLKLTLRYKRYEYEDADVVIDEPAAPPRFVLTGVQFATGKATLTPDSYVRLDTVVEYMTHKKSARIEISGHTDNVGKAKVNKKLSQKRANACRDYLVSKGIEASRIEAIGFGDEKPIAANDTPEGRQKNRRIEAKEL